MPNLSPFFPISYPFWCVLRRPHHDRKWSPVESWKDRDGCWEISGKMSLSFVLIYGCVTSYIPFVNICWVNVFSIYPAVTLWLPPLLEWYLVPASTRRFQIWLSSSLPIPRWADKRSCDLVSEKMSKKYLTLVTKRGEDHIVTSPSLKIAHGRYFKVVRTTTCILRLFSCLFKPWGRGDTQRGFKLGGSARRSNPLPFYTPFLTEKVPVSSYTFSNCQMV